MLSRGSSVYRVCKFLNFLVSKIQLISLGELVEYVHIVLEGEVELQFPSVYSRKIQLKKIQAKLDNIQKTYNASIDQILDKIQAHKRKIEDELKEQ